MYLSFFLLHETKERDQCTTHDMPPCCTEPDDDGDAVLRRGAGARGAIRGTAIAVHRRRNTDPPAMAGQPAVGTPCKQAPRQRGLIAVSSVGISTLRCPCNEDAAAGTRMRLPRGDEWRRNAAKRTNGGEKAVTWTNGRDKDDRR